MSRLKHSPDAYVRSMQLSDAELFAFVEGKSGDRNFYGRLCSLTFGPRGIRYQVVSADEIQGDGGGKKVLLNFFSYLRSRNLVDGEFKGKRTAALFFLDKDIDDMIGVKIDSPYIVYTQMYDLEGQIFAGGDVSRALAAVAGLDEIEVSRQIGNPGQWRLDCAITWREWIEVCVFCKLHSVSLPGYGVISEVNSRRTDEIEHAKLHEYILLVKSKTSFTDIEFETKFNEVKQIVSELLSNGKHGQVFKGKWFLHFAERVAQKTAAGRSIQPQAIHHGLLGAILASMTFEGDWTVHFTRPLENLFPFPRAGA